MLTYNGVVKRLCNRITECGPATGHNCGAVATVVTTAGQLLQLLQLPHSCHSAAAGPAGPVRSRVRSRNAWACDGRVVTKDVICDGTDRLYDGKAAAAVRCERRGRRYV